MRLAIAFLLAVVAIGPATAQQPQPKPKPKATTQQQKPANPPEQPAEPATQKETEQEKMLRQRLLLKERFNKGYDVQIENAHDRIESKCKNEARRAFSALHPIKRRRFAKDCIAKARR
jgi:outer membrane biosynthesis protein TonB